MKRLKQSALLLGWFFILLGIVYPMLLTLFAHLTWNDSAHGSLLVKEGKVRGSVYVGQQFKSELNFWPRPSASNYSTLPSLPPERGFMELSMNVNSQANATIPPELRFESASGLDPDLALSAALFQIDRVAKARGLDTEDGKKELRRLVMQAKVRKPLNLFGRDCVNILLLNHSLETLPNKDL